MTRPSTVFEIIILHVFLGLTQNNPRGLVLLKGGPVPLTFKKSLELSVQVAEVGVAQIVANLIRGTGG